MKVLHLIRKLDDSYPFHVVAEHARNSQHEVEVVYWQDAVYRPRRVGARAYVLDEDCRARGVTPDVQAISYQQLVDLIFTSDRVLSW
jgi:sulfur relay protein TusB/DsrH